MNKKLKIAICAPNESSSSETFIANHVQKLEGEIFFVYGGWLPTFYQGKKIATRYQKKNEPKEAGWLNRFSKPVTHPVINAELAFELFLKEFQIDVVLAEYGLTGVQVGPICKKLNIPFVVHFHGFDAYHHETLKSNEVAYRTIINDAAAVIAVSEHMQKQLVSLGVAANKIKLIHYGVNLEMFDVAAEKKFNETFIAVGRFVTKKAPHLTILAFSEVLKEFKNAKLIMAGDAGLGNSPELFIACKQLVNALKIQEHVQFTGVVSQSDIAELMKKADVFVQHSVTSETGDSEGTPNSVLEGSAAGLCVVATVHAGIPDVVLHNQTGLLCKELDLETMTEYMKMCLRNPAKTIEMGKAGAERIRMNFNLKNQLDKLYQVLEIASK